MQSKDVFRVQESTIVSRCMKCAEVYRCVVQRNGEKDENYCSKCSKIRTCEWHEIAFREAKERSARACHECIEKYRCTKQSEGCIGHCISCSRFRECKRAFMVAMSHGQISHGYCSLLCQLTHFENLLNYSAEEIGDMISEECPQIAEVIIAQLSALQCDDDGTFLHVAKVKDVLLAYLPKR